MARTIAWEEGAWSHPPALVLVENDGLHVTAREGSDAWRVTSYGFVRSSEHALLSDLPAESAVEVQFRLDFSDQFDQAGIFARVDDETWIKAGVELCDGEESLGAVVTQGTSDWSLVRVAPLDAEATVTAGPFCCAPTRAGLVVHFTSWLATPPDAALHP